MKKIKKSFPAMAKVVRKYRLSANKGRGYSQGELSNLLGYKNGQFVSNIERGLCGLPLEQVIAFCRLTEAKMCEVREALREDFDNHIAKVLYRE